MNEELRSRYVRDLILDLAQVGGARLERWIKPLWDHLAGSPVTARGINPEGSPVSGALDAVWPDGSVSEASSDLTYFSPPYEKPGNDFRHALKEVPGVRIVRLFSTRTAGPAASMVAERVKRRLARRGYQLDLWDGRRIAEHIVDELLLDERYVTRVGDALPNLRRIAEQNAASARVPEMDPLYASRGDDEKAVLDLLYNEKCVVVSGMGGIGKTELACAVAHRVRDRFEMVIWMDGERVEGVDSLRSFDVRLNGYKLDVLDLLANNRTLLVLDNSKVDLDLARLTHVCGEDSRVLITSQVRFGEKAHPLGFLGHEEARHLLSAGMPGLCPDEILEQVLGAIEGHALVLRMLNGVATQRGWPAVALQCPYMAGEPDEKRRTVAARILEQHLQVLGPELSFFAWCRTGTVDRGIFEHIFGPTAVEKLERWALTARGQSDAVRLHDIVYLSVERIRPSLSIDEADFEVRLGVYIASQLAPKRLGFFRVVNRHRAVIERLLRAHPEPGVIRYAYLHGHPAVRLDSRLVGDPIADAASDPGHDPVVWLLSIVEAVEADYRRMRNRGDTEAAKAALRSRLKVFDVLLNRGDLPPMARAIATHHKAKSLLKLREEKDARTTFETLLDDPTMKYAAKLQVARLSKDDREYAKSLIFEIIEAEQTRPNTVAASILLDTLATMRRAHLRRAVPEMTARFGAFMAQQIKAAACSGEDQPIRAFAGVGADWSYHEPELFFDVLGSIDLGTPEDGEDDDERIAIGRLLSAAGKAHLRDGEPIQARRRFEQAVAFLSVVDPKNDFASTHHADALLKLEQGSEAAHILDRVRDGQRDEFWLLRRSEAHLMEKEYGKALARIDEALDNCTLEERRSTFLAQKAEVLFALRDPAYATALEEAIKFCDDGRYRNDLIVRLETRRNALH